MYKKIKAPHLNYYLALHIGGRGIDLPQLSFKLFVYKFISNKISLLFHPLSLC
jgi:hypothetical protein